MPIFGLNNGMVPIIAYNYGARRKAWLMKIRALLAVAIMAVGLMVIQLIPDNILGLFEASPDMLAIGVPCHADHQHLFPLLAGYIISSSTFQALGQGIQSMLVSIIRQLVVLLPGRLAPCKAKRGDPGLVGLPDCGALLTAAVHPLFFLGLTVPSSSPWIIPG